MPARTAGSGTYTTTTLQAASAGASPRPHAASAGVNPPRTVLVHRYRPRRRERTAWLLPYGEQHGGQLPSGGHVESTETTEEAAIREAREETGLSVQLLPGPAAPVPAGYPHKVLCAPWWITEMGASPDSHTASRHVHVDHVFAAVASSAQPASAPAHTVRWFSRGDVTEEPGISQDSRLQALELLARI